MANLEEEFDLLDLLQSKSDLILHGGKEFGLGFEDNHCPKTVVDLGTYKSCDFPDIVPKGYEESSELEGVLPCEISRAIDIAVDSNRDSWKVKGFKCLPTNGPSIPVLKISYDHLKVLQAGERLEMALTLTVNRNFTGFLGRWIIFTLESVTQRPTSVLRTTILMGFRIVGIFLSNNSIPLSLDAKPFIPQSLRTVFDQQVSRNYMHTPNDRLPPNYSTILPEQIKSTYLPAHLKSDYDFHAAKGDAAGLVHLLKHCVNETLCEDNALVAIRKVQAVQWFEELQMLEDIVDFDLHFCKIIFEPTTYQQTSLQMTATVKVVGSNESRPKISLGDMMRFRPTVESLDHFTRCYGSFIDPFELVGMVTKYVLPTEEVACIFSVPLHLPADNIVTNEMILSIIHNSAQKYSCFQYHARFTFERCGMVFVHEALACIQADSGLRQVLFPDVARTCWYSEPDWLACQRSAVSSGGSSLQSSQSQYRSLWHGEQTGPDELQLGALDSVLEACGVVWTVRAAPYIIHGPPGTGKTKTVIEAILRILDKYPGKHILACAPSDAAADVICLRLAKHLKPSELFRLNWWQRLPASLPPDLDPYCRILDTDKFDIIGSKTKLRAFKVIVSTCGAAGVLRHVANLVKKTDTVIPLLFDVVIVDECSQATDAETLIPLSLCKVTGVSVLAGDPQQLGATMRTSVYRDADMAKSLQERLLEHDMYRYCRPDAAAHFLQARGESCTYCGTDGAAVLDSRGGVFLRNNYRSHQSIIDLPSKLFYSDALIAKGCESVTHSLLHWERLSQFPKPFPMLFIGVPGKHQHDMDSPSFHNISEISEVVNVCKQLVSNGSLEIHMKDIGVIAAFRSQVLKLRLTLRAAGLRDINVGSVEDYQGQEFRVIVISTVLTSHVAALADQQGLMGLVNHDRRFNVAVTRGVSLCIVVGEPYYLHGDKNWREFMNYCDSHGGYTGMPCTLLKRHIEEKMEEQDLLNTAAHMSLLGCGYDSVASSSSSLRLRSGRDLEFRMIL